MKEKKVAAEPSGEGTTEPKKLIRVNREFDDVAGKRILQSELPELKRKFVEAIQDIDCKIDCIIFKDHQKGFLSEAFLGSIATDIHNKGGFGAHQG
jgi:hypothetical protein